MEHVVTEVVVIGAGAAGVGAARRLRASGAEVVVLEAQDRVGGRAHTIGGRGGAALDLGCGWLHSADRNELARLAESLGFTVDRSDPAWTKQALSPSFPADEQRAYRRAFAAFERRLESAAREGADRAASELLGPEERRWIPMLNAFSGYYNGAPFDRISIEDYAAYQPTNENWRVVEGYGALIVALADGLDVRVSKPARLIEHGAGGVRVSTDEGEVEARAAIVTVSTAVLASEALAFDPPLSAKLEAARSLPLGYAEKVFLKLGSADDFPPDSRVQGRTDSAETASYTLRPLGSPFVEAYFGGDLAAALARQGRGALTTFARDELGHLFGSNFRDTLEPVAESQWTTAPFIGGAYSHAMVGHASARARLAEPVGERLLFAGEACSAHAFSTAHGAWETGVAAAFAWLRSSTRVPLGAKSEVGLRPGDVDR